MKNLVMMLVSGMLGILFLAVVMTICGRMSRSVELQANLSAAVEMSVEQMVRENDPGDWSGSAAEAECIESMAAALDTDSDVTVNVYQADAGKGVLAMKVEEQFLHPNGKSGMAEWERIAIYNRSEENGTKSYEVRFYKSRTDMLAEGSCYKTYVVQEGTHLSLPADPVQQGAVFAGWKDAQDYMADFSQPVEENRSYYADWE